MFANYNMKIINCTNNFRITVRGKKTISFIMKYPGKGKNMHGIQIIKSFCGMKFADLVLKRQNQRDKFTNKTHRKMLTILF